MKLSTKIFIAIFLGILHGYLARVALGGSTYVGFIGEIFKALLMMIIAPLVFSSIVMGVAGMGDLSKLRGLGKKTLIYYFATTFIAVIIGIVLVNVVKPGTGADGVTLLARMERTDGRDRALMERAFKDLQGGNPYWGFALFEIYLERYGGNPGRRTHPMSAVWPESRATEVFRSYVPGADALSTAEEELDRAERARRVILSLAHDHPKLLEDPALSKVRKDAGLWWDGALGYGRQSQTMTAFLRAQIQKVFKNPFTALANNDVLAIITFALLLGFFLVKIGEPVRPVTDFIRALNVLMMAMTGLVMEFAPYGVFALMADAVNSLGIAALTLLGWYMFTVTVGILIHGGIVLPLILKVFTGVSPVEFFSKFRAPIGVAFSTSSSSATLPVTLETVTQELGVSQETAEFVTPLGATVNMDGTALYESVAAIFIAQLFGIHLDVGQQILIFITATLAAVGAAGIPSAGTVTMVMVLSAVDLPVEGIALILAVDRPLDAIRTTCNVIGDGIGAVVVDRLIKGDGGLAAAEATHSNGR